MVTDGEGDEGAEGWPPILKVVQELIRRRVPVRLSLLRSVGRYSPLQAGDRWRGVRESLLGARCREAMIDNLLGVRDRRRGESSVASDPEGGTLNSRDSRLPKKEVLEGDGEGDGLGFVWSDETEVSPKD